MVVDFYDILEIEPAADRSTIDAALEAKRRVWSSGTRNPKYKHAYQSYLDRIPEIKKTLLGDATARAAYDAELTAARRAERDAKLDDLQRLVRLRSAKGGLTVTDRALLRERTSKLGLEPVDLERMIESIPPRPDAPPDDDRDEPTGTTLDDVMRRQIGSALEHVRKRDLYDALGVTRDALAAEIKERADEERDRWMRKTQVTAEKTVWLEVVSHAQSQLLGPENRDRYDRTLVLEAEEAFRDTVEFGVDGLRTLDPATRSALLDEASRRGISTDRADRLIARCCKAKGIGRDAFQAGGPIPVVPRSLRCRSCGGLNDFASASRAKEPECRHCRASLRWACPSCRSVNWIDEARCRCKFPIEYVEPLIRHYEAAQKSFRVRDDDAARAHLERMLELHPGHANARKGLAQIAERRSKADEARRAYLQAKARRAMVAARNAVAAWSAHVPSGSPEIAGANEEIDRHLVAAAELVTRARVEEGRRPADALKCYRRALELVSDLTEAREGMLRCPPDPPTKLNVVFEGDRFVLRWTPPPPDDLGPISFVVCRKSGEAPRHPGDGRKLGQVAAASFEDRTPPFGETVGYTVFSARGSLISATGAASAPATALAEVSEIQIEARDREVVVGWSAPARSRRIIASRRAATEEAETRIDCTREGLLDRDVENHREYVYRIASEYETPDGEILRSRGIEFSVRPHPPIEALPAPTVSVERDGVRLSWTPPPLGTVKIVRSVRALPFAPGTRITANMLAGTAFDWLEETGRDSALDREPPAHGACRYTPLTAGPEGLVVGHPATFSSVRDPSDLRAVRIGSTGEVHLRWRWGPHVTESLVVARAGTPPTGPDDPDATVRSVLETEYGREGYCKLSLPPSPKGSWHIAVHSATGVGEDRIVSPGADPTARTIIPGPTRDVTLSYAIGKQGFPGRALTLTLRTDPPGSLVPPTVLVAHDRTVPMSADDGRPVARFPASADGTSFPIKAKLDLNGVKVRLFPDPTAPPDQQTPIRVRHPGPTTTRV